jgi:multidrug efflux system membrane fusion protein
MANKTSLLFRVGLPVAVLVAAVTGAFLMVALKPEVETRTPIVAAPLVRVEVVKVESLQMTVKSQGTVMPRNESQLIPEVSGKVLWVSPSLAAGGFFENGEPLVRIDPFDYRQALVIARSDLARSKLRLAQEEAEARVARREWLELGQGDGTPLTLREPQLEDANAAVAAAAASLERAERNLDRTELRAPYAGRVRQERVDLGQFVSAGAPIATIYSVDAAEIRLPLPDEELAFVDISLSNRNSRSPRPGSRVVLSATFAGRRHEWSGRIVRTEGEIDPLTRMIHAVAEVNNPYDAGETPDRPPLTVGMFVEADIEGKVVENVVRLPRAALKDGSRLWVIDGDSRLRYRLVTVYRLTEREVLLTEGLKEGELVCLSPLDVTTDGMLVRVADAEGKSL